MIQKNSVLQRPRLNQSSLKKWAERHRTSILASAYRNQLLSLLTHYLSHLIDELESRDHESEELCDLEKTLEAIEAALIHLWVDPPYNGCLTIPRRLPEEQICRLRQIIKESRRLKRPLRLAYTRP